MCLNLECIIQWMQNYGNCQRQCYELWCYYATIVYHYFGVGANCSNVLFVFEYHFFKNFRPPPNFHMSRFCLNIHVFSRISGYTRWHVQRVININVFLECLTAPEFCSNVPNFGILTFFPEFPITSDFLKSPTFLNINV